MKSKIPTAIMIYSLVFIYAISTAILGTVLSELLSDFSLDVSQGGIFTLFQYVGSALGILFSGYLLCRYSKWNLLAVLYGIFSLGMIAILKAESLVYCLTFLLIVGISTKLIDVVLNATISQVFSEHKGLFLNILHGCFGAGSFAGPLISGSLLARNVKWQSIFAIIGIAAFALLIIFIVFLKKGKPSETRPVPGEKSSVLPLLKERKILLLMLVLFFYCGHQVGISSWVPMFLSQEFNADTILSAAGVSFFWLGLIICRFTCSALTTKFKVHRILLTGLIIASCLFFMGTISRSLPLAIAGCCAAGLFAGGTVPLCITLGYESFPYFQSSVSMLLFLSISAGQMIFPWIMGYVAKGAGLTGAMLLNISCLAVSMLFAIVLAFKFNNKKRISLK